ncbi:MAG: hypothetical protein AAFX01_14450 [Cyanobacteria bacterium J06638_28]
MRFTSETPYGLIDIDARSPYCHPEAIAQLSAALETDLVIVTQPVNG